jgi:hypothetical protein
MKNVIGVLAIVLVVFTAASAGFSQLFQLTGHITGATGTFLNYFAPGDPIKISFDLTPPLEDIFHGGAAFSGVAAYNRDVTINAGSGLVLPLPGVAGVFFYDAPHINEGLYINCGWSGSWQLSPSPTYLESPFLISTFFILPPGNFVQQLLSDHDVLPSLSEFPGNLPMSEFFNTDGYYELDAVYPFGTTAGGRVDWTITDYRYGAESLSPVPESNVFGMAAAAALVAYVMRKYKKSKFIPEPATA